jgi:plasmid stabilization system protein ParE
MGRSESAVERPAEEVKQKTLLIRFEARKEIDSAFDWYFERSPKAADAFLAEVDASLAQIVSHPQLHPLFTKNTPRRVLERFPYSVIFQEKEDVVLVIAVAHAKRRFGYWGA